jgi:CBS domain-containing protein
LPVLSETPHDPKALLATGNWEPATAFAFFSFPRPIFDIYSAPGSKTPSGFASFVADEFEAVRRARFSTCPREAQMLIRDLLKNQVTISAEVHQTVLEVARLMAEHHIGAVPVLEGGQMVGIFSERDLMNRVVVAGKDPARTPVGQAMTDDPLTVAPDDPLETCMTLMKRHGFRHLPVCAGRDLKGVVSLRDILLHDLDEKDDEVRMMRAYLHSTPDVG